MLGTNTSIFRKSPPTRRRKAHLSRSDGFPRVVPVKAGTHTPCPLDWLRRMGPGSLSAFTRVFDALWAGTTLMGACHGAKEGWTPDLCRAPSAEKV
jgi:hypothetical protein